MSGQVAGGAWGLFPGYGGNFTLFRPFLNISVISVFSKDQHERGRGPFPELALSEAITVEFVPFHLRLHWFNASLHFFC